MKDLPYYRLWVKDFDTNEAVRELNLAEAGLFLFALNHAWINDGLPSEPESIRRVLKISPAEFRRHWPLVAKCFFKDSSNRLRNKRQEEERQEALSVSIRNSANVRKRYDKPTTVEKSYTSGSTTRAYDCVSGSGSLENLKPENKNPVRAREAPSQFPDFAPWWNRWCELTGRRLRESLACQAWLSVVTMELAPAATACLERYGASDEVMRGIVNNPDRWLYDQARDKFAGEWQERKPMGRNGIAGDMERYLDEH